ncbi:hypothetical protein ACFLW4_01010 [Chloroflexota bacterium]
MTIGKLYRSSDNQFVAEVNYQFQDESATNWWGELTLTDYLRISESDGYIIELEDNRKGKCRLRKRVNRAVSGVPPRYVYQFTGTSTLE